jgi:DEAD/DEAH box helicase domain-containing protein
VDLNLHAPERRHPAASFRAIHVDPEAAGNEKQQQAAWREWLRQGNLFQFLPHGLLSTPGWGGAEQPSAVDPPQVWIPTSTGASAGEASAAAAERQRAWQELSRFSPEAALPLLEALAAALQATDHPLPEQAFELEGPKGAVLAQAELAWPEQRLAVVANSDDLEAFTTAGWRCWSLEDPPERTAAAVREALASP